MFETQKSGNKTSSGEIGLHIRTLASPKVGQDQVSGGVRQVSLSEYLLCSTGVPLNIYQEYVSLRVIDGEYIVKISRVVVKQVYKGKNPSHNKIKTNLL